MRAHYEINGADRDWFARCPRSWDFSARPRQGLEPLVPVPALDLNRAVLDALAVYYFPGMWTWDRGVVAPLVFKELERALHAQRRHYDERAREAPLALAGATGRALSEDALDALEERYLEDGHQLLLRYLGWAPEFDLFWPIRVEADFDGRIPDLQNAGRDLATPDGRPIHFQGRVNMLMADQDDARWLVLHRVTEDEFSHPHLLRLDETALGLCWGWENDYLVRIGGVVFNELRLKGEPAFQRTAVAPSRTELANFGQRLSRMALQMVAPDVDTGPHPTPEHCTECAFRSPCLAMNEGDDPGDVLAAWYRHRPEDELVEGRLGAVSWSMSRGAAPPRFEGGRTQP